MVLYPLSFIHPLDLRTLELKLYPLELRTLELKLYPLELRTLSFIHTFFIKILSEYLLSSSNLESRQRQDKSLRDRQMVKRLC
jgi:hypothetical protein